MSNSFGARATLKVGGRHHTLYRLDALEKKGLAIGHLPFSLRILLENLLRCEDKESVFAEDIEALAKWSAAAPSDREIAFTPARVLLQDFTGVPCVVDLAAMRDAMANMKGDPNRINPLQAMELVIDHSVQVDHFGTPSALADNTELEYARNRERYAFLRWGQSAFKNFRVVPPETGIVHQVNLEYLARVVFQLDKDGSSLIYPDTLVGTDSHTTMINGLGVLGWGVGGIEAEAAMLGQPVSMLIPEVVGFKLSGRLPEGATATDLVLTVTQMLRKKGVVGKFVEFFGPGLKDLPLADRATIANMAPEYGATCGIFPVDAETLRFLRFTGRSEEQVTLVEAYMKEQGLFHTESTPVAKYSATLELDMGTVEPSLAGPKRPQDRVTLKALKSEFTNALPSFAAAGQELKKGGAKFGNDTLNHGAVVIAAITSCTNTSNPSVLMAAGLLAQKAVEKGLTRKPWVKTSLAPGSQVVTAYLSEAGLDKPLDALGFNTVGYGCTTCIGNSGPLPETVSKAIADGGLIAASILSGNRNFEGRVHAEVKANYLASPPLVVAYALAGRIDLDPANEPLGNGKDGKPVYLKDIWPSPKEVADAISKALKSDMFRRIYGEVFKGDDRWNALKTPTGARYEWDKASTYVRNPPYFDGMPREAPRTIADIQGARVLAYLGDSITTDHISPAGNIKKDSPAGKYLMANGVEPKDFNQYGARRGNHEVMVRGTFANVRLRNKTAPGTEGGVTTHYPSGEVMSIYDASVKYQAAKIPLIVLAGKEYGSGSSRDWAAKGPYLLGIKAAIAESYERIHRSNLVGMGIVPLQFKAGESAESLGLTGREVFEIVGLSEKIASRFAGGRDLVVRATDPDSGKAREFTAAARVDTAKEIDYVRHGGILQYVLRKLLGAS